MADYRIELHGSTIDRQSGTLRIEVPSLYNDMQLSLLNASQFGVLMGALIDTKGWVRAYVLADDLPVAALYRERADKVLRELEPPVASRLYVTAGDPEFLEESGLAELPMVSDTLGLLLHAWTDLTYLQGAQEFALLQLESPACAAVVFHSGGEVVAAWERRHIGNHEPMLVAASAKAVATL